MPHNAASLTFALPEVTTTMDPHLMENAYSMLIVLQVHRGLMRYSPQGEVLPDLAESWEKSADGLSYKFKLRKMTFSDGTPLKALHVANSFARIFLVDSSMAPDLAYIRGADVAKTKPNAPDFGVKALSDHVVEFKLSRSSALFFKHLATVDCAVIRLEKPEGPESQAIFIGAGPYRKVTRQLLGQSRNGATGASNDAKSLTLEKWRPDLLDSENPPQLIEYHFTPQTAVTLAQSGLNDSLDREVLDKKTEEELLRAGWTRSITEVSFERFVLINPAKITLPVRKYLFSRVNQDKLAAAFSAPGLRAARGLVPGGLPGELAAGGLDHLRMGPNEPAPKGSVDLEFAGDPIYNSVISKHLKESWETGSFKVNLKPMPSRDLLNKFVSKEGTALVIQRGLDYFDGFSILSYFRSTSTNNNHFVSDLEIDKLLDKAVMTEAQAERAALYRQIQERILSHYTVIPLTYGSMASGLWSPKIKSIPAHPGGVQTLPVETISLKK